MHYHQRFITNRPYFYTSVHSKVPCQRELDRLHGKQ